MAFQGTTTKCTACAKTVYLVDKLTADNRVYHKPCFRCHHCKGTLKLGNYNSFEGVLYCRPHFDQLFKMTGSLDKSFDGTPKVVKPEKQIENEVHGSFTKPKQYSLVELLKLLRSITELPMSGINQNEPIQVYENAIKVSSAFAGTREKCVGCKKTVYPIERVTVNGTMYHKSCFKCTHGGCTISPSNYIAHEGKLYCKHHHLQLIKEKGNFSQLEGDIEKSTNGTTTQAEIVEL